MKIEHDQGLEKDKRVLAECFALLNMPRHIKMVLEEDNFRLIKTFAREAYYLASREKNYAVMDKINNRGL